MLFPFGFPWPTAPELALFVATSTIYVAFMQCVLGGAIVLLAGAVAPGARRRLGDRPGRSGLGLIVRLLRDTMPAMLGLGIAAGFAPLVLLEVLYRRPFGAGDVLGFHRFLLIPPALIAAYWLLDRIRRRPMAERRPSTRVVVTSLILACLAYAAWVWTEDHVLGLRGRTWGEVYASGRWTFRDAEMWPRLGYAMTASFPTLATVLAWQLHWRRPLLDPVELDVAARRLRILAILGLAASSLEAWLWVLDLDPRARGAVLGIVALPYGLLAVVGAGIQAAGWLTVKSGTDLNGRRLAILSAGAVLTILGALVVREARRLAAIDIAAFHDDRRHAAGVVGLSLAFLSTTIVAAACVRMTRGAPHPLK